MAKTPALCYYPCPDCKGTQPCYPCSDCGGCIFNECFPAESDFDDLFMQYWVQDRLEEELRAHEVERDKLQRENEYLKRQRASLLAEIAESEIAKKQVAEIAKKPPSEENRKQIAEIVEKYFLRSQPSGNYKST